MNLSKSLYTRGLQCTKSLWLKKYNPEALKKPDEAQQSVFATGDIVGELACKLFPNGVEVEFNQKDYDGMINTTSKLIDDGVKNIYEASFNYDGIFVAVDILHINDDKSVEIYEVKSSTYKSTTSTKDLMKYIHDASIQYYVLNGLGYDVKKTSLVLLNSEYIRDEKLEIEKLFKIVDISNEVLNLQQDIPLKLKEFEVVLSDETNEPNINIGTHCNKPYECDAKNHCWKDIPEYSMFNIFNLGSKKQIELYSKKIVNIDDIDDDYEMTQLQATAVKNYKSKKININKEAIQEFLNTLTYPIYHLDFETFQQAVPQFKGISPYMQIPFQYSLHIQDENDNLVHKEFLSKEAIDPRYELAKQLVEDIPTNVTVLAYNMGFEKGVIKKLALSFEEFSMHLMAIHDNIKDLMIPFKKEDYYDPAMKGSYSIKYVMPALVPEMEKAYQKLVGVQNGSDAMNLYPQLGVIITDEDEIRVKREQLLEYCKLDTLSMVEILRKLRESVNE